MEYFDAVTPAAVKTWCMTGCATCTASLAKRVAVPQKLSVEPAKTANADGTVDTTTATRLPRDKEIDDTDGTTDAETRERASFYRVYNETRIQLDTLGKVNVLSRCGCHYAFVFTVVEAFRNGETKMRCGRIVIGSKTHSSDEITMSTNKARAKLGLVEIEVHLLKVDYATETRDGTEFSQMCADSLIARTHTTAQRSSVPARQG